MEEFTKREKIDALKKYIVKMQKCYETRNGSGQYTREYYIKEVAIAEAALIVLSHLDDYK